MGWADCGNDRAGRPIGYAFEATCDHPECDAKIDRGLSYACGDMHGEDVYWCDKYFCGQHLNYVTIDGECHRVCAACLKVFHEEIRAEVGCTCDHDPEWHEDGCACEGFLCGCTATWPKENSW